MSNQLNTLDANIIASLVINGDLSRLTPDQKVAFYNYKCQQAGLDPAAKPFDLLKLNGKEILYANIGCTQQLTANRGLSHQIVSRENINDTYCVFCRVTGPDNRSTENMGAASLKGLVGEAIANAMMKATSKAIRRTVLAHCGLGLLDDEFEGEVLRPGDALVPMDGPQKTLTGDGDLVFEWMEADIAAFFTYCDTITELGTKIEAEDDTDARIERYKAQKAGGESPLKVLGRMIATIGGMNSMIETKGQWSLEAQQTFADGLDALYAVLREGGKEELYEAEATKWRKRMAKDGAGEVLAGLEAYVKKLQNAVAKKAVGSA